MLTVLSISQAVANGLFSVPISFEVLATENADFNQDGDVDGGDFLTWQQGLGIGSDATLGQGDADRNGAVNNLDLVIWQQQFAAPVVVNAVAVPEPSTLTDAVIILVLVYGYIVRGRI